MPRVSGNYNLPSGQPVVAGTVISDTVFNTLTADIANEITNSMPRDGTAPPTANIPMGGFKFTGSGNGAATDDLTTIKNVQDSAVQYFTATGTDTITGALSPALASYVAGQTFKFTSAGANTTTTVTLNINGLGAKSITKNGSTALSIGDIKAGAVCQVVYDGTQFQLIGMPGTAPFSDSTALIKGSVDPTKLVAFEVDGLTTATTRTLTVQDANGTIALVDNQTFTGAPAAPTPATSDNSTKLATTAYANNLIASKFGKTSTSVTYTPAGGEALARAHGLSAIPSSARLVLECAVADANFSIGERVSALGQWNGGTTIPLSVYVDATICGIKCNAGYNVYIYNKTTGAAITPTANAWKYYFEYTV